ncbi:MAG: hypothetical protein R3F59_02160 [Myxococcota bacterium]
MKAFRDRAAAALPAPGPARWAAVPGVFATLQLRHPELTLAGFQAHAQQGIATLLRALSVRRGSAFHDLDRALGLVYDHFVPGWLAWTEAREVARAALPPDVVAGFDRIEAGERSAGNLDLLWTEQTLVQDAFYSRHPVVCWLMSRGAVLDFGATVHAFPRRLDPRATHADPAVRVAWDEELWRTWDAVQDDPRQRARRAEIAARGAAAGADNTALCFAASASSTARPAGPGGRARWVSAAIGRAKGPSKPSTSSCTIRPAPRSAVTTCAGMLAQPKPADEREPQGQVADPPGAGGAHAAVAAAVARRQHDLDVVREVLGGHAPGAGQRVARAHDRHQLDRRDPTHVEGGVGRVEQRAQAEVGLAGAHGVGHAGERLAADAHGDVGVARLHDAERGRQGVRGEEHVDDEAQLGLDPLAQRGRAPDEALDLGDDGVGVLQQHAPAVGEGGAASLALEQGDAEGALEARHRAADGGLRALQLPGGRAERPRLGDGHEHLELAEVGSSIGSPDGTYRSSNTTRDGFVTLLRGQEV